MQDIFDLIPELFESKTRTPHGHGRARHGGVDGAGRCGLGGSEARRGRAGRARQGGSGARRRRRFGQATTNHVDL